jgi:hypothetical protein
MTYAFTIDSPLGFDGTALMPPHLIPEFIREHIFDMSENGVTRVYSLIDTKRDCDNRDDIMAKRTASMGFRMTDEEMKEKAQILYTETLKARRNDNQIVSLGASLITLFALSIPHHFYITDMPVISKHIIDENSFVKPGCFGPIKPIVVSFR